MSIFPINNTFDFAEEILERILLNTDLPELKNATLVCKLWKRIISSNIIWKNIAEKIGCFIGIHPRPSEAVYTFISSLRQSVRVQIPPISQNFLPQEAYAVLSNPTPRIQEIRVIQNFQYAKSTLTVWKKLAEKIGINLSFEELDTSAVITKSKEFSAWFAQHEEQLKAIQLLDLSKCDLTSLPPEIGRLTNLQCLFLNNNYLTDCPFIENLTQLHTLHLENNRLHAPPLGINNIKSYTIGGNPFLHDDEMLESLEF